MRMRPLYTKPHSAYTQIRPIHHEKNKLGTNHAMPVQLSDRSLLQMLLRRRDIVTGRKIRDNLLADPSTVEQASLGVGEAPLEVHHKAIVRRLSTKIVRVLQV